MKKRVLLVMCVLIIVALGIVFWQSRGTGEKNPATVYMNCGIFWFMPKIKEKIMPQICWII